MIAEQLKEEYYQIERNKKISTPDFVALRAQKGPISFFFHIALGDPMGPLVMTGFCYPPIITTRSSIGTMDYFRKTSEALSKLAVGWIICVHEYNGMNDIVKTVDF